MELLNSENLLSWAMNLQGRLWQSDRIVARNLNLVMFFVGLLMTGDRATIEPGIPCWKCRVCIEGLYNLCPDLRFPSSCKQFPHANGTLQTLFNHPEELVHRYLPSCIFLIRIPDDMSFEEAALYEPLSVALQACQRTGMSNLCKDVMIFGAGAIRLLIGAVAKSRGAKVAILCSPVLGI